MNNTQRSALKREINNYEDDIHRLRLQLNGRNTTVQTHELAREIESKQAAVVRLKEGI